MLFPLFSQLDYPVTGDPDPPAKTNNTNVVPKPNSGSTVAVAGNKKDPVLCSALMQFICELVEGSTSIQQQVLINAPRSLLSISLAKKHFGIDVAPWCY